jgi:hypothetical protein
MAYTQADLDAIRKAMASGARRVRYPDGSDIEYRSLAEMQQAEAMIKAEVSPPAAGSSSRTTLVTG